MHSSADALPLLAEAVQLAAQHGMQRELCDAETEHATELCRQERWDEAIEIWQRVIERGRQMGVVGTVSVACVNLADVLLRRGEWQRANVLLDQAQELARRYRFPHVVGDLLVNRALSHWLREQPEQLVEATQAALEYAQQHRLPAAERNARSLRLLGLLTLGRDEDAQHELASLAAVGRVTHPTWSDDRELAAIARARFEVRHGHTETAERLLMDSLREAGDSYAMALLQLELAHLIREQNPDAARSLVRQVASCAARLRSDLLLERVAILDQEIS